LGFSTPLGLEDVSRYPALFAELIRTGQWTAQELKQLAGLNFLRVIESVENVRIQLQNHLLLLTFFEPLIFSNLNLCYYFWKEQRKERNLNDECGMCFFCLNRA